MYQVPQYKSSTMYQVQQGSTGDVLLYSYEQRYEYTTQVYEVYWVVVLSQLKRKE